MDGLIKQQVGQKLLIENALRNYNKDAESRKTEAYYERRLKNLLEDWTSFRNRHFEILAIFDEAKHSELPYFEKDVYSDTENTFLSTYAKFEADRDQRFPPEKPDKATDISISEGNQSSILQRKDDDVKLPRIQIPTFNGDYKLWPEFYDMFKAMVHDKKSISSVQKLQYLKLHVKGEPASLIRHFLITDKNYQAAWSLLIDRYNNKRVLVNAQLQSLLSQGAITSESSLSIKNLLDNTTQCLQTLENLDIDISSWDAIIVYLTVQKLPAESHQLWEQSVSKSQEVPEWKTLREFLEARFRALEAVSSKHTKGNFHVKDAKSQGIKLHKTQSYHSFAKPVCPLCTQAHKIRQCSQFLQMSHEDRFALIKAKGLCTNCLGYGHIQSACPSKFKCAHCAQKHHTLLHKLTNHITQCQSRNLNCHWITPQSNQTNTFLVNSEFPNGNLPLTNASSVPNPSQNVALSSQTNLQSYFVKDLPAQKQVLLATALVTVCTPDGFMKTLRTLIDQGSEASFISEHAAQSLHLKRERISATVSGIGQNQAGRVNSKVRLMLTSTKDQNFSLSVTSLVLKTLTSILPSNRLTQGDWNHLIDLELADPYYYEPSKIDLLLGSDVYPYIILDGLRKGKAGEPIAQNTVFGWILSGEVEQINTQSIHINNFHSSVELDQELRRFWELEEIPEQKLYSEEEKYCEELFQQTTRRLKDGRYEVQLPFADRDKLKFGKSRDLAIARLRHMERRFRDDPLLQEEYTKCLREYKELDHMKLAITREEDHASEKHNDIILYSCCYLPHHAVLKLTSSTTKLRVVFDGSAKTRNGVSLNDALLKGPTIQPELGMLLPRWRKYKIAFMADVEKMYRQVRIAETDENFQRIVWRESTDDPIKDYVLKTVTFGTKSAPFLAIRALKQLAIDEKDKYPLGSQAVLSEMYVDDLISGADSVEEALDKQNEIINIMNSGKFNIRKWASNSTHILENIPEKDREMKLPLNINCDENIRALGVLWNPVSDHFSYTVNLDNPADHLTKRIILSDVAKLFDPLGWLVPVTITAKIMIQTLWLQGLQWDEIVPTHIKSDWLSYRKGLAEIQKIKTPRWIFFSQDTQAVEFHGYCDASRLAYAAVVQICVVDKSGKRIISLISAKSKVAPIKTISIPRLELCAALLLAKLLKYEITALNIPPKIPTSVYAWSDSQIVLAWLKGHPAKWTSFVANRVTKIHEVLPDVMWRYIPSKENPADCASRGLTPIELRENQPWWHGPIWLKMSSDYWPKLTDICQTDFELRKSAVHHASVIEPWDVFEKYSSLQKLCRVIAYCIRFWTNLKLRDRCKHETGYLKPEEIQKALMTIIRTIQRDYFGDDIKMIESQKSIKSSSALIKLNPFVHEDGLLRVGGRLRNAELPFDEKYPIILPPKSFVTTLLIRHFHASTLHGGAQLTMMSIRQRYWIPNCRKLVRLCIHRCIICHRHRLQNRTQLMGDLPQARVTISRPFTHVGVDYCGPFDIKSSKGRGIKSYKGYVSIFICLVTRAIHLELVSDLSTNGFLAAFRRFVSRRGIPAHIYSDRGTNFIGANIALKASQSNLEPELEFATKLANEGIQWHFNPPASPHFGGLWEAGVKSTKHHLKRIIGPTLLTFEEFITMLTQIECCLNSRPISELTNDPDDLTPLTPGHFLVGSHLKTLPERNLLEENPNHLNRWHLLQHMMQSFWKRWSSEYLSRLQQRPKWTKLTPNVAVGDLVLLKDEKLPPCEWRLARIVETHPGADGLVRVVTIKTQNTVLKRPLSKISPLPISSQN